MNTRYQVFVSSTYADLKDERAKVIQTIMELDCIPAGMEIFPAIDEEQFEFIKKVIDDCDYYILIIGGRYGSLSEDGISYTEKEYDYAIGKGIKVIAFLPANPDEIPFGKTEKDIALRERLELFKTKVSTNRLIKYWKTIEDLPGLVALSLSKTIKTYPAIGWVRSNATVDPTVYKQISELQIENQDLKRLLKDNKPDNIISAENLADLDDNIELNGTYRWFSKPRNSWIDEPWKVKLTWKEIFGLISPFLLDHPSDSNARSIIGNALYVKSENPSTGGIISINEQDFQTLKIQLIAKGLVEVNYLKTASGGMSLFWNLTSIGDSLMLKIRTIKK